MSQETSGGTKIFPPMYFFASILAMLGLHAAMPGGRWLAWPWSAAGIPLVVTGLLVAIVADQQFKRHGTTVKPFQPSSALVTDGMFRLSRNPMYLGMVLVLAGLALWLGSALPWIVLPVFTWLIARHFIAAEERALERQFGRPYVDYKARVRRWL